ncbi:TPA: cupin domain-containing protein [Burkholderia cenocepacia]|uniref:cupin domain-containing protein n=1 Tax=Burkholderia cepacia complex TaxID=87882 RepID=UPI000F5B49AF|nr:cupin domain-containing protein [Burkholderia cenocepacia]MBR8196901.1 cupin domain-containing protein [Burkholderia cenocepacia]MBR8320211.1 cupin domain-containing protein [Burkholderia cenocepacia]MBR8508799.1 cupin domain-containing protein [Burkholderia cenocepacia]RQV54410.1 cupin domain-containing protein [Burkholderia cenocepacia]HDR9801559.1 cupin domain-containing protein [Burkholderia cenocepacia]
MSLIDFKSVADAQAAAWTSTIVGEVGPARIKVLRMDAQPYEAEVHDYNEGLLVLDGTLMLEVDAETVVVGAGQMYLAHAGTRHAVLPGSHGTLAIIDV